MNSRNEEPSYDPAVDDTVDIQSHSGHQFMSTNASTRPL